MHENIARHSIIKLSTENKSGKIWPINWKKDCELLGKYVGNEFLIFSQKRGTDNPLKYFSYLFRRRTEHRNQSIFFGANENPVPMLDFQKILLQKVAFFTKFFEKLEKFLLKKAVKNAKFSKKDAKFHRKFEILCLKNAKNMQNFMKKRKFARRNTKIREISLKPLRIAKKLSILIL